MKIKTEQVEGRGNPPKGWIRKPGDRRLISWKGLWNIPVNVDIHGKN